MNYRILRSFETSDLQIFTVLDQLVVKCDLQLLVRTVNNSFALQQECDFTPQIQTGAVVFGHSRAFQQKKNAFLQFKNNRLFAEISTLAYQKMQPVMTTSGWDLSRQDFEKLFGTNYNLFIQTQTKEKAIVQQYINEFKLLNNNLKLPYDGKTYIESIDIFNYCLNKTEDVTELKDWMIDILIQLLIMYPNLYMQHLAKLLSHNYNISMKHFISLISLKVSESLLKKAQINDSQK